MNNKDRYSGIALLGFGIWIGWEASGFPTLAGMPYGPGLFPTISAVGLGVCGMIILASSFMPRGSKGGSFHETTAIDAESNLGLRATLNTACVLATVILYALLLDVLGFHLVSFFALLFLFVLLKVKWWTSLALSAGTITVVHLIFYSFLHVPLPWGLLEPIAW